MTEEDFIRELSDEFESRIFLHLDYENLKLNLFTFMLIKSALLEADKKIARRLTNILREGQVG